MDTSQNKKPEHTPEWAYTYCPFEYRILRNGDRVLTVAQPYENKEQERGVETIVSALNSAPDLKAEVERLKEANAKLRGLIEHHASDALTTRQSNERLREALKVARMDINNLQSMAGKEYHEYLGKGVTNIQSALNETSKPIDSKESKLVEGLREEIVYLKKDVEFWKNKR